MYFEYFLILGSLLLGYFFIKKYLNIFRNVLFCFLLFWISFSMILTYTIQNSVQHWNMAVSASLLLTALFVLLLFVCCTISHDYYKLPAINLFATVTVVCGVLILSSYEVIKLIFFFESMVISALLLLGLTIKTERGFEALIEMSVWTFIGSFFLISGLIHIFYLSYTTETLTSIQKELLSCILLVGFAVKIPLWPFISWLLKAHVEASTEFSIFLSGFLVKFGVWCLYKIIVIIQTNYPFQLLCIISLIGFIEACFRLFMQVDLKRVVALTTVVETNWIGFCLSTSILELELLGLWLVWIHCLTTTLEFYVVDLLYKRYLTRNVASIGGITLNFPNLAKFIFFCTMVTIGLPGTSIFAAKFLFSVVLCSVNVSILVLFSLFFFFIIPVFFVRLWTCMLNGQVDIVKPRIIPKSSIITDISFVDYCILFWSGSLTIIMGLYPSIFI